jgi:D-alanine-D-alanine ligase
MIKVGVVRGGPSSEYDVSLKTGGTVISHLLGSKLNQFYKPIDILIDKSGVWHKNGTPTTMENIFHSIDVIFNAMHGEYGEDGKIQQALDQWQIPYTGSRAFPSAVGFNKALSKERFNTLGIKTPAHILLPAYQEDFDAVPPLEGDDAKHKYAEKKAHEILGRISPPWIVKPLSGGSSVGMHLCKSFPQLVDALKKIIDTNSSILIEEFIQGKEATVGVIENFRGKNIYTLPPIEIRIPPQSEFFDYEAKYGGQTQEICPGNFTTEEKEELEKMAGLIHTGLGLSHYSRSDFIIHPKKGIYALEVNTLPGLTNESLIPKALNAVGSDLPEFIDHLIKLAQNNK